MVPPSWLYSNWMSPTTLVLSVLSNRSDISRDQIAILGIGPGDSQSRHEQGTHREEMNFARMFSVAILKIHPRSDCLPLPRAPSRQNLAPFSHRGAGSRRRQFPLQRTLATVFPQSSMQGNRPGFIDTPD